MKKEDKVRISNDLNYELWILLNRTRHLINKARQNELLPYNISIRNAGILHTILLLDDPVTPKMIANELFLELHTISEMLKRMEKQGLILRKKDLGKKNLIRVEVTEKGLDVYQKSALRVSINKIMSILTEEEKHELTLILHKLRGKAKEISG